MDPGSLTAHNALSTVEPLPITATQSTSSELTLRLFETNSAGDYVQFSTEGPDVVKPAHADYYFAGTGIVPAGGYEFWEYVPPGGWYNSTATGTETHDIFINGTSKNISPGQAPPDLDYSLNVVARSADDPDLEITGGSVTFTDSGSLPLSASTNGFEGSFTPSSVSHPTWTWLPGEYDVVTDNLTTPEFTITLWMKRGMGVSGRVENAVGALPLTNTQVTVRDRFGGILRTAKTDGDGMYVVDSAIESAQTVFIDVNRPGFISHRSRNVPDPMAGTTDLVVNVSMEPLPPPMIEGAGFDRFGLFLPGIRKAGSESAFNALNADEALTFTWTGAVTRAVYTNSLPSFDQPDGSTGSVTTLVVTDKVASVYLVDKRQFPGNRYNSDPVATNPPPASAGHDAVLDFIRRARAGVLTNLFIRHATSMSDVAGKVIAEGKAGLWELPHGDFDPALVVFSHGGGVAVLDTLPVPAPTAQNRLTGLRFPRRMSVVSDILGFTAATQATAETLDGILPLGRFTALPTFSSSIEEIEMSGEGTGFVKYEYDLDVGWKEGQDAPDSGLLALAPGTVGLEFKGNLGLEVNGMSQSAAMNVTADVNTTDLDGSAMLPKAARKNVEVSGRLKAGGETILTENFSPIQPLHLELTHEVGGGFGAEVKANLEPVLGKIPYAGPVFVALNQSKALSFFGIMEGGIGQESKVIWRTFYPPPTEGGTTSDPDPRVLRRHTYGGDGEVQLEQQLCFRFGLGVSVEALGNRAGATGKIVLQGNECGRQPAPSASVTYNPYPDWPPVKRLEGKASAIVEAFLDVWVTKVGKEWEWDLITWDVSYGTDPVFELIPMTITGSMISPQTATPAIFEGESPVVAGNLYPAGGFTVSAGASDILSYVDINPANSSMVIRAASDGGAAWMDPGSNSVIEAGGIISYDMKELADGSWMLVWNQIDVTDIGNPFPTSSLHYATSPSGTVWSAPASIAGLTGVASRLELVCCDGFTGLLFLEADEGPSDLTVDLKSSTYSGSWSAPVLREASLSLDEWATASAGTVSTCKVVVAYSETNGVLSSRIWDGITFGAAVAVDTNAAGPLDLAVDTNGWAHLAWTRPDGIMKRQTCLPGGTWTNDVSLFAGIFASELSLTALSSTGQTVFLSSWIEGGDTPDIWTGWTDENGALLRPKANLTQNSVGRYHRLRILPESPGTGTARILSLYTLNPTSLREFTVSYGGGSLNDADGDLFNDLDELHIIDADPFDAVDGLEDVTPFGDFDLDGIDNWSETYLGFDATSADSSFRVLEFIREPDPKVIFQSTTNVTYHVESTGEFPVGWTNVMSVSGDNFEITVTDTNAPGPHRQYRISVDIPAPTP